METMSRINSIAAIHELTENTVDETVSLKEILSKIACNTKNYVRSDCQDIEIDITGDDMRIEADQGVQIAIVINELVSNAVIHGFHNIDTGKIIITINKGTLYTTISVEDNGIGFHEADIERKQGLGLDLVKITVKEKLKGDLKISSDNMRTCISFDFK
jgi:two-component sensor histidine kinase